jgi:deoxycytidine triphosphate deaminase
MKNIHKGVILLFDNSFKEYLHPMTKLFSDDPKLNSSILSDKEINDYVSRGHLIYKDTFNSSSLEASSYDLRVGGKGIIGGEGVEIDLLQEKTLEIPPGAYAGIVSFEKMNFPRNICARLGSKRALSYDGIILLSGSIVDPGYEGHLLFGLYNASQKKVHIRYGRKICNIVFERLAIEPEKEVQPEPNLINGNFPDAFMDKMANMDVLPWMQISERVKQIENITKDIIDLKARYEDVLEPIKDLTTNVKSLTSAVSEISNQTKTLTADLQEAQKMVQENSKQINQLTNNLTLLSDKYSSSIKNIDSVADDYKSQNTQLTELSVEIKGQRNRSNILWVIVLLVMGALISWLVTKALG